MARRAGLRGGTDRQQGGLPGAAGSWLDEPNAVQRTLPGRPVGRPAAVSRRRAAHLDGFDSISIRRLSDDAPARTRRAVARAAAIAGGRRLCGGGCLAFALLGSVLCRAS